MKPTIIGFFPRHEIRTGSHKRYLELLHQISLKGYDVKVIISSTIDSSRFNFQSIKINPIYSGKIPFSLKQMFKVIPILVKLPKTNYVTLVFGETNYLSTVAAKILLKCKVIFAFRSNTYKAMINEIENYGSEGSLKIRLKLFKMKSIERRLTKLADHIIFQTTFDSDDISKRNSIESSKITIIPNSINETWFDKKNKNSNKSDTLKNILYLGSYSDRKGVMFLLEAINLIKDELLGVHVSLFGYGNEKIKLENYIKKHELSSIVTINDKMTNPISQIGQYDLMVIPSIYDSYPNVILESIFTGTPVIASNNSGMKEILYYNDLLFNTADPKDIAFKIKKLLDDLTYVKAKKLCMERQKVHDFNWPDRFISTIEQLNC